METRRKFGNVLVKPQEDGTFKAYPRYTQKGKMRSAGKSFPGDTREEAKAKAQVWLADRQALLESAKGRRTITGDDTVKGWCKRWLRLPKKDGSTKKPKTLTDYEQALRLYVYPYLGDMPLHQIDVDVILGYQAELDDDFENGCSDSRCTGPKTCRAREKAENYFCSVLKFAVRKRGLLFNPYDDEEVFIVPVKCRRDPVPFVEDDIEALFNAFHPHYAAAIMVAAYLGPRSGEMWALQRKHVNLLKNELWIRQSVAEITGKGLVLGPPKNGEPRPIAIPAFVAKVIEAHMLSVPGGPNDWLFPNQQDGGGQVRHSTFMRRFFRPALGKAKLPMEAVFHDLRHYCARYHISQGMELADVTALLGHRSTETTWTLYGGLFDKRRQEMAIAVDKAYRINRAEKLAEVSSLSSRNIAESGDE